MRSKARRAVMGLVAAAGACGVVAAPAMAQQKRVYIALDDHTDYWWTASETEYRAAFLRSLDYYLDLADATAGNPSDTQSRFNCDGSLWLWEYEKNKTPAEFDRLIGRIRSGHISVPLNPLCVCLGGAPAEAVLRGMYYPGQIERRHGLRFEMANAIENQTLSLGLPALWAGSGAKYSWKGVCGCATQTPELNNRGFEVCTAKGPDGSGVLLKWYSLVDNQGVGGYAEARFPNSAIDYVTTNAPFNGFDARHPYRVIGLFGKGWDDFETLTSEFVTVAQTSSNASRRIIVSNQLDYFRDFEQTYALGTLPVQNLSLGNEWDTDAAALAEVSARIKRSVEKLRAAEAMASLVTEKNPSFMAGRQGARDLAHMNLGLYWEHDFGMWAPPTGATGVAGRIAWQKRIAGEVAGYVDTLHDDAAGALAGLIATDANVQGTRFYTFNPLSFTRTDVCDLEYAGPASVRVIDLASGDETPSQIANVGGRRVLRVLAENVPGVGYKVFEIRAGAGQTFSPAASVTTPGGGGGPTTVVRTYSVPADERDAQSGLVNGQPTVRVSGYNGVADPFVYFGTDFEDQTAGVQFQVDLPSDAVVQDARLIVSGSPGFIVSGSGAATIGVYDVDSASPFVNGQAIDLINHHPVWATTVAWPLPSWSSGSDNSSPNLAALVQRVVDRPGYAPGAFVGFAIDGGTLAQGSYYGFDDVIRPGGTPARLQVTFTSASLGGGGGGGGGGPGPRVIDNGVYAVTVQPSGAVTSIIDRTRGNREFVRQTFGRWVNDLGGSVANGAVTVENEGPVSVTLVAQGSTPLAHTSRITLYRAGTTLARRIDIENTISQNFDATQTWAFGFELAQPRTRHEEVGAIARARLSTDPQGGDYATRNARYDYLTLNHFVDMSSDTQGAGVTLANSDALFFTLGGSTPTSLDVNTPSITVLAGGRMGFAALADQGGESVLTQRFALRTHGGYDLATTAGGAGGNAGSMRFGLEQQNPLVGRVVTGGPGAPYPAISHALLTISDPDVLAWSVKPADDNPRRGLIVRAWNVSETGTSAAIALPGRSIRSAWATTHIETDLNAQPVVAGAVEAPFLRQQIRTFRVSAACPGDFNRDQRITVQDLFDFLAAWFGGTSSGVTPDADISGEGALTVQDLFDFLALWFGTC